MKFKGKNNKKMQHRLRKGRMTDKAGTLHDSKAIQRTGTATQPQRPFVKQDSDDGFLDSIDDHGRRNTLEVIVTTDKNTALRCDASTDLDLSSASSSNSLEGALSDSETVASENVVTEDRRIVLTDAVPPDKGDNQSDGFMALHGTYLLITLVIMLADGLQGTHLYVLYDSYGYSVASLYCLGYVTGGLLSPITGPLVDKMGRKKAAILYCALEVFINQLEQYPYLPGLIASRMIGGFTTNLLSTVFEAWLDTEYRSRGFDKAKYEIIMRDAVIVSNMAAIGSGFMAEYLNQHRGATGPFQGAVACTTLALAVVAAAWNENYGSAELDAANKITMREYLSEAAHAFATDSRMLRVGVLQGLSTGALHVFIYLWEPALLKVGVQDTKSSWGVDKVAGEPAFGYIFSVFMFAGVVGGFAARYIRQGASRLLSSPATIHDTIADTDVDGERPMAVEFVTAICYLLAASMFLIPVLSDGIHDSFSLTLGAFVVYEFLIGIIMPCEGVIRSLYFPKNGRASVMVLPRTIVNITVSVGVVSTTWLSIWTVSMALAVLLLTCGLLQLSLISGREWATLYCRADQSVKFAKRLSCSARDALRTTSPSLRRLSSVSNGKETDRDMSDSEHSITSCSTLDAGDLGKIKAD